MTYPELVKFHGASNHWRLGELSGTSAVDIIGGANGTISGGVTLGQTGGVVGDKAMLFDGINGKVTHANVTVGTTCTIEFWIKPTAAGAAYTSLIGNPGGGVSVYYQTNKINCFAAADNLNVTPLVLEVFSHVVIRISVGAGTFYVNGIADGTFTAWPGQSFSAFGGGNTSSFPGSLDEVAIYPRALTAAEISAHYATGFTNDFTLTTQSIPIGPSVSITQNIVYATPADLVSYVSNAVIQESITVNGPWTNLAVNQPIAGGFIRCATGDTAVVLRRYKT